MPRWPMAKPLTQPPPSSTAARLLDVSAAARATGAAQRPGTRPVVDLDVPCPSKALETLIGPTDLPIKRELILNRATDETFAQLVEIYRRATGARLSASHVARAILKGIACDLPALQREANRIGRLRLPSNARGHELEREQFERRLANAFVAGMRSTWAIDQR